ncbi:MAG: AAA family ATPase [Bacteroidetes bacterium]|nr:MAG: AAA family ATPase [Bacteroidota bacterium]
MQSEEVKIKANSDSSDVELVDELSKSYNKLRSEIAKVIVGQDEVVKAVLTCIFSQGHCLLIGVPGLAKTLLVQTIADALGLNYSRIQFTPDLMPSDITGSEILDENRNFRFVKGPVFANIILADEINRTPPKTQAALLEAMQEFGVTVAGQRFELEKPFFVLATQNPIELEGTYPLPEAQLDRFMFNVWVDYPGYDEEIKVVKNTTSDLQVTVNKALSAEDILKYQQIIRKIPITDNVLEYAVNLVHSTRPDNETAPQIVKDYINWGAGPRASQYLSIGAKCNAVLSGKYSPDIEDVKTVAMSILRHRIIRNYKAEAEGVSVEDIVDELMK